MTVGEIRDLTIRELRDMVGNPFEYATDDKDGNAMMLLMLGVIYGILEFEKDIEDSAGVTR